MLFVIILSVQTLSFPIYIKTFCTNAFHLIHGDIKCVMFVHKAYTGFQDLYYLVLYLEHNTEKREHLSLVSYLIRAHPSLYTQKQMMDPRHYNDRVFERLAIGYNGMRNTTGIQTT